MPKSSVHQPINKPNFFLITGGPGAGKTSVLNELNKQGHFVVPEVARKIIQAQNAVGGNATHSGNRDNFCDLMLEQSIADFKRMELVDQPVFFDRGIPDLYGYSQRFCCKINTEIVRAIQQYRYNTSVFIFPPWPEESEQKTLGIEQVNQVLQTMIQLINIIPDLITSFEEKDNSKNA